MKENKLITILKTFSKEEMKKFGLFISSPYFNRQRDFKPLYSILKNNHPSFPPDEFTDEKLFSKLYPNDKFERKKASLSIRVLFSQITNLAKKFIVYDMFESGGISFEYNNILASGLRDKNLLKDVYKLLSENSEQLDSGNNYHLNYTERLKLNRAMINVLFEMNDMRKITEPMKNDLLYAYAFIFHHISYYLTNSMVIKYNYNITFSGFELIKSFIEGFDPVLFERECSDDGYETKNITLFNYYITRSRFDETDIESLLTAMDIYMKMFPKIPQISRYSFFQNLFNRFERRISYNRAYLEKANELVDFIFEQGIYSHKDDTFLKAGLYNTTLLNKAALLNAKELRDFIDKYVDKTSPELRADLREYSMSYVCFKEKYYEKCLRIISKNDSLDNFFKIGKYKLKMCSLYELGLIEETHYALDSFEHFLRRKKDIGPILIEENLAFTKGIKQLLQLKSGNGKDINPKSLETINNNTLYGDWLKEKVSQL